MPVNMHAPNYFTGILQFILILHSTEKLLSMLFSFEMHKVRDLLFHLKVNNQLMVIIWSN